MNIGNDIRRIRVEPITLPISIETSGDQAITEPRAESERDPAVAPSGGLAPPDYVEPFSGWRIWTVVIPRRAGAAAEPDEFR